MTISNLATNKLLPKNVYSAASISSTTGSPSTGSFTDANGFSWNYYKFTASTGSIIVSNAGYADILVVGGGGGGTAGGGFSSGGGGGGVRWGTFYLPAATYSITVGAGGAAASAGTYSGVTGVLLVGGGYGGSYASGPPASSNASGAGSGGGGGTGATVWGIGTSSNVGGGAGYTVYGANAYSGISLNYSNATVEYGMGGYTGSTGAANTGNGGYSSTGGSGIVIVKVRTA